MFIRVAYANYQAAISGSAVGYPLPDKETGLGKGTVGKASGRTHPPTLIVANLNFNPFYRPLAHIDGMHRLTLQVVCQCQK